MIFHLQWTDRLGVQHDAFTDQEATAIQLKTALSSDGRFCQVQPTITPEKVQGD